MCILLVKKQRFTFGISNTMLIFLLSSTSTAEDLFLGASLSAFEPFHHRHFFVSCFFSDKNLLFFSSVLFLFCLLFTAHIECLCCHQPPQSQISSGSGYVKSQTRFGNGWHVDITSTISTMLPQSNRIQARVIIYTFFNEKKRQ